MNKILSVGGLMTAFALVITFVVTPVHAATTWDTTGSYIVNMNYQGGDYPHDMSLVQDGAGNLTGNGGSPAGANTYTWVINSGTVVGDAINFTANYTATEDAVTPQTVLTVAGTIAEDGTISGTWSDNYAGGERSGMLSTISGAATTTTPAPTTSKVTILKYVDGAMATASSASSSDFQMNAAYTINGAPGTGQYALSASGYNGDPTPYRAQTSDLPNGSDYATNEMMDAVVGASCTLETKPFALIGYTYGNTLEEARMASSSPVAPSFTNIQSDKYVIVWNDNCSTDGQISGEVVTATGTLAVTSVEVTDSQATADGTFENGWKYTFNVTLPTNEPNLTMKFADWMMSTGSSTIPAGNNMRISSSQANNGGATVPITAANTYSAPPLTMTTDLDPMMDGIQVKVVVEVKIPTGTTNGSYTTNYGVKSQ